MQQIDWSYWPNLIKRAPANQKRTPLYKQARDLRTAQLKMEVEGRKRQVWFFMPILKRIVGRR